MKQKPNFLMALGAVRSNLEKLVRHQSGTGKPFPAFIAKQMNQWSRRLPSEKAGVYLQWLTELDYLLKRKPEEVQEMEVVRRFLALAASPA